VPTSFNITIEPLLTKIFVELEVVALFIANLPEGFATTVAAVPVSANIKQWS